MTPEEQAALDAAQEKEIRDLAAQITQMAKLGFDPMTIRKATIASVNDTSSPPTVGINISGDNETLVSQVRTLNNYTPLMGQTVLLAKQGTEIFIFGAIAANNPASVNNETDNGWKRASLAAGSHGGNGNGDIYYRRVLDHGAWKMQWRGGWNASGTTIVTGLDPDYRPSSLRSLAAARNSNGLSTTLKVDFGTDGSVTLAGSSLTANLDINASAPGGYTSFVSSHSHGVSVSTSGSGGTGGASAGTAHTHGVSVSTSGSGSTSSNGGHDHSISVNSHFHGGTVSTDSPTWVSLNGLEYFL